MHSPIQELDFKRPSFHGRGGTFKEMFNLRIEELAQSSELLYNGIRTIVPKRGDTTYRIDNQPCSQEVYNISFQAPK